MSETLRDVLVNGTGVERAFLCPVHGDSRPSASVNVLKGLWFCYTCGAKGNLEGISEDVDYLEIVEELAKRALSAGKARPLYTESWLNLYDSGEVHPYWLTRFSAPAIKHFRLGYDHERDAVTYPLRTPAGRILGVVRRPLDNDGGPKYLYPYGVDVSELLFNFDFTARATVYLVEGALDAVACWEAGVDAFAIYGARMSAAQMRLLDKIDVYDIVCVFDMDAAGEAAYEQVKELAVGLNVTRRMWPVNWGKDIAELDVARRVLVLSGGLDQVEETREGSIGSSTCEDYTSEASTTLRDSVGREQSRTTSRPARLRIVPPRT